jgi:hypothetical protein
MVSEYSVVEEYISEYSVDEEFRTNQPVMKKCIVPDMSQASHVS